LDLGFALPATQVCILDGNKYSTRCRETGEQRLEILDECEVLRNQKGEPLLASSIANNDASHPQASAVARLQCTRFEALRV
jgi:hypothetical protein